MGTAAVLGAASLGRCTSRRNTGFCADSTGICSSLAEHLVLRRRLVPEVPGRCPHPQLRSRKKEFLVFHRKPPLLPASQASLATSWQGLATGL